MGHYIHDAIVVSSFSSVFLDQAVTKAAELGLQIIGPNAPGLNNLQSFLVCPDGSKEGWLDSNVVDKLREEFLEFLRGYAYLDGSSPLEWVYISYSCDQRTAQVNADTWHPHGHLIQR